MVAQHGHVVIELYCHRSLDLSHSCGLSNCRLPPEDESKTEETMGTSPHILRNDLIPDPSSASSLLDQRMRENKMCLRFSESSKRNRNETRALEENCGTDAVIDS